MLLACMCFQEKGPGGDCRLQAGFQSLPPWSAHFAPDWVQTGAGLGAVVVGWSGFLVSPQSSDTHCGNCL